MYPTKEKILEKRHKIDPKIIEIILSWKKEFLKDWKTCTNSQKIIILRTLLYAIVIKIPSYNNKLKVELGKNYSYNQKEKTIYLEGHNPSILSTLHELAHHLFGHSELKACRWSYWLFATCFPKSLKKLKWENHMLKK